MSMSDIQVVKSTGIGVAVGAEGQAETGVSVGDLDHVTVNVVAAGLDLGPRRGQEKDPDLVKRKGGPDLETGVIGLSGAREKGGPDQGIAKGPGGPGLGKSRKNQKTIGMAPRSRMNPRTGVTMGVIMGTTTGVTMEDMDMLGSRLSMMIATTANLSPMVAKTMGIENQVTFS